MDGAVTGAPLMQSFPWKPHTHSIRGFLGSHQLGRTVSHTSFQMHPASTVPSATTYGHSAAAAAQGEPEEFLVAAANPSVLLKALTSNPPPLEVVFTSSLQQLDLNSTEESPDLSASTHLFQPSSWTIIAHQCGFIAWICSTASPVIGICVPPSHLEHHWEDQQWQG